MTKAIYDICPICKEKRILKRRLYFRNERITVCSRCCKWVESNRKGRWVALPFRIAEVM